MKAYHLPLFIICLSFLSSGCSTSKDTAASRSMQNLTTKYNILYNANILLDESIQNLDIATPEDYGQLLSVFKEPTETGAQTITGNLDSIILKAKTIIDDKLYSKYVGDAYFLTAQANFYKARFYTAAEFFTYVYNTYPNDLLLRQHALIYQARAIMQLDNFQEAGLALDTAQKHLNDTKKTKRTAANLYATTAQFLIKNDKQIEAIEMLQKAIQSKGAKLNKIRWTYVLAQLQEQNKLYDDAYKNYTAVVKSNAPFDMAFNAGLNRISIEDTKSGENIDRIARLVSLLKDEKNKDFIDQIHYRIGDEYFKRNETNEAIKSYNNAIRLSTKNQTQKGLSYLRIADIYFKNGDYVGAKMYYDSTLTVLPPSYAGYDIIRRKGNNLELLANRFKVIGREDTLQMLARLPQDERQVRVGALVREQMEKTQMLSISNTAPESFIAAIDNPGNNIKVTEGKFYFNNTTAISQGLSDFKRRWGNRKLEDNWRRSSKTSSEMLLTTPDNPDAPITGTSSASPAALTPEGIQADYAKNIPLTDSAMQASNQRIADSYYDVASFYRDELKDNNEAIKTFEELLRRAPESTYKLSVYYNLYRLYADVNQAKSDEYKNLLLTKYPESPFAKVIADPEYGKKSNEKEVALNTAYNQVYDLYTQKKYTDVIKNIVSIEQQYGNNILSPQLAYLNALAVGHTQKLVPFETTLQTIITKYPDDQLITPLVQQHVAYINTNRNLFDTRTTALTEYNPFEPVFIEPTPQTATAQNNTPSLNSPAGNTQVASSVTKPVKQPDPVPNASTSTGTINTPAITTPDNTKPNVVIPKPLYDLPASGEYYFVINVQDAGINLNSSRFGIGQFNRSRFAGSSIKHQLKDINNESQLIFVGSFENYDSAKFYERSIIPLIKDIMKVPVEKYNTFVIVKQELDKLTTSTQINAYLEFYKNSR